MFKKTILITILVTILFPFKNVYAGAQTRAEFIHEVITSYEAIDGKINQINTPFTDIEHNPYKADIEKAYVLGLIRGVSTSVFEPNVQITQAHKDIISKNLKRYKDNTKKNLTVMISDYDLDVKQKQMNHFMSLAETSGMNIEFITVPQDYYDVKLKTMIAAGNMPDVFEVDNLLLSSYDSSYTNKLFADMNSVLSKECKEDLDETFVNLVSNNGRMIFLPIWLSPEVLIYDKAMTESYGIMPPKTWEEAINQMRRHKTDNKEKYLISPIDRLAMINILHSYGMTELVQNPDGSYYSDIGTEKFKDLLLAFANIDVQTTPHSITEFNSLYSITLTMLYKLNVSEDIAADTTANLAYAPFPMGEQDASVVFIFGYAVSESCKDKDVASLLLDYLSQKDIMEENYSLNFRVPTKKSALNEITKSDSDLKTLMETKNGFFFPLYGYEHFYQILDILQSSFERAIVGENIDTVNRDAKKQVEDLIQQD